MTGYEIAAFLAVVRERNISKAANELYITQSALSRRIKSLEDELGYQLIDRNRGIRTVELTQAGCAFLNMARKWDTLWKEAKDIGFMNDRMSLNISLVNSVISYVMPGFFFHFAQENPQIYLTIKTIKSVDVFRYAENKMIDLALFSDDINITNIDMKPAYKESLVLVAQSSLEYPPEVSITNLDSSKSLFLPWNREYEVWYNKYFSTAVRSRINSDSMQLMEEFLRLGDYWAIVPASIAQKITKNPALSTHIITENPPERIIYYLSTNHLKDDAYTKFLTCFDAHLKREYKDIITSLL